MAHEFFMHRCIERAKETQGRVGNGALVWSVLVREGKIIAEAHHRAFGLPHAERSLLDGIEQKISSSDILYVNMEPCCHYGKTPPCTDIIIEKGIKHVVYGMRDPDQRVAGKGIELLKAAGIEAVGPVLLPECERLNRGFVSVRNKGRPWITLKRAQMRDGTTANTGGARLMITSQEQNVWSHTFLRSTHDAILVGVRTVTTDDPVLDARFSSFDYAQDDTQIRYQPSRIVLDPHLRIPMRAKVVSDSHTDRTMIVTSHVANEKCKEALRMRGVRVLEVAMDSDQLDWKDLWRQLITPSNDYHGLTSILVEGGAKTWDIFKKAGMVDEEVILTRCDPS